MTRIQHLNAAIGWTREALVYLMSGETHKAEISKMEARFHINLVRGVY